MLSVRDHMVIDIASRYYRHPGRRVADMLEIVGYSETRFVARVLWLVEQPEVAAAYPAWVRRQVRLRETRRAVRSRAC